MKTVIGFGPLALAALIGCGSASAKESVSASSDYPPVAQPPPPPPAPPPGAEPAPQPASAPTASPAPASAQPGPLPAFPSSAPQVPSQQPASDAQPVAVPVAQEVAPPAAQWVYSYPTGQWVFTSTYGWIWVPAGTETTVVEDVPYAYLYTPGYGWTWYVSPWGGGPYRYGVWVRHPWVPRGWHRAWVAHPRVVVHLGRRWHRR